MAHERIPRTIYEENDFHSKTHMDLYNKNCGSKSVVYKHQLFGVF